MANTCGEHGDGPCVYDKFDECNVCGTDRPECSDRGDSCDFDWYNICKSCGTVRMNCQNNGKGPCDFDEFDECIVCETGRFEVYVVNIDGHLGVSGSMGWACFDDTSTGDCVECSVSLGDMDLGKIPDETIIGWTTTVFSLPDPYISQTGSTACLDVDIDGCGTLKFENYNPYSDIEPHGVVLEWRGLPEKTIFLD
jgi:hypothetical protein